jgi:hypothetical protein
MTHRALFPATFFMHGLTMDFTGNGVHCVTASQLAGTKQKGRT